MSATLHADYLVVGAGAAGMAFTDALVDHADVRVLLVDRRSAPGGHWLDAYPFVRLHQASRFYGVASTVLGDGLIQQRGPEAGLHERATGAEVRAYYEQVLARLLDTGRVTFHPECGYRGEGRFVSLTSGAEQRVDRGCRVVDARYLAPEVPASTPPPFGVADGALVVPVNELTTLGETPGRLVIVGSGKTATDACVRLLDDGIDPDRICWVRPRDPWMLNRAVVQPDPAVFIGMAADTMEAAAAASSLDDLFLRLEAAGVMLRIDPSVLPTMAKTPTLAQWELERLRTIEHVVRRGHLRHVEPGRLVLDGGEVRLPPGSVIVHCAAPGLRYPPLVPVWGPEAITLQPIRAGFPCFGAALVGYVEANREQDEEKNRLCPPSPLSDTLAGWARMQVLGARAARSFGAQSDIKAWADQVALNPAANPPESAARAEVITAVDRLGAALGPGLAPFGELAGTADRP